MKNKIIPPANYQAPSKPCMGSNPKPKGPPPSIQGCGNRNNFNLEALRKSALNVDINIKEMKQLKKN